MSDNPKTIRCPTCSRDLERMGYTEPTFCPSCRMEWYRPARLYSVPPRPPLKMESYGVPREEETGLVIDGQVVVSSLSDAITEASARRNQRRWIPGEEK